MKMNFEIGNKVSVLDEDLSGRIIKIDGNNITIETADVFEMTFSSN